MNAAILSLFAGLISLISGLVGWWIANNPRIRNRKLWERIHKLEDENREAVAKHDMVALARIAGELYRLRQVQATLSSLGL